MATLVRPISYYEAVVPDRPGEAWRVLKPLADAEVDLVAFSSVSEAGGGSRVTVYPSEAGDLEAVRARLPFELEGPFTAILAQGADRRGALASLHERLHQAGVNVLHASGVSDGRGDYGYIVHVAREEFPAAVRALDV